MAKKVELLGMLCYAKVVETDTTGQSVEKIITGLTMTKANVKKIKPKELGEFIICEIPEFDLEVFVIKTCDLQYQVLEVLTETYTPVSLNTLKLLDAYTVSGMRFFRILKYTNGQYLLINQMAMDAVKYAEFNKNDVMAFSEIKLHSLIEFTEMLLTSKSIVLYASNAVNKVVNTGMMKWLQNPDKDAEFETSSLFEIIVTNLENVNQYAQAHLNIFEDFNSKEPVMFEANAAFAWQNGIYYGESKLFNEKIYSFLANKTYLEIREELVNNVEVPSEFLRNISALLQTMNINITMLQYAER